MLGGVASRSRNPWGRPVPRARDLTAADRLAASIGDLKPYYDAVVVGSGYGGAVAAARLAFAGQTVCVLERGREFQPGEYPDRLSRALAEIQVDLPGRHLFSPTALYDLRVNPGLNVFVGCGLGGTSLINANVALRPPPSIFQNPAWPAALRRDAKQDGLARWFERAERVLETERYPVPAEPPRKFEQLRASARQLGTTAVPLPLNVNFRDRTNPYGIEQHACAACADCVSGCNYGAKNTLIVNYLPIAKYFGAELYTETRVRWVEPIRSPSGTVQAWRVHFDLPGSGRARFAAPALTITARTMVLAAGALGTTEILLRSRDHGLSVSDRLGERFSANGDVVAFAYNNAEPVNAVGFGRRRGLEPVGPCITGGIDGRDGSLIPGTSVLIEEGAIPGALSPLLPWGLALAALVSGKSPDHGLSPAERRRRFWARMRGLLGNPVRHTQTYLVMADDPTFGRMSLRDDRLRIDWPAAERSELYARIDGLLERATRPLGGLFVSDPLLQHFWRYSLTTVHPLGGCAMAETAEDGVVNHAGAVFAGRQGADVHHGLYACDASVIPYPLATNPLLTITALAERSCDLLLGQ